MSSKAFSTWPAFCSEQIEAVNQVLLSGKVNYWTGNNGKDFEREFAQYVGSDFAVALANGTVAIDLALKALSIGEGDEIIVTSRTFVASVSSIANAGAKPVFADVDPNSQNITASTIEPHINPNTKAILCVHLAGWPCDMDPIIDLAMTYDLFVVEDCAQAHGALYKGRSVGTIGHIGCWSFCQDKIMTTCGEGGMVTTNDRDLWSVMWSYKDHGKSPEALNSQKKCLGFRWLHDSLGTNWRMTEVQAAIGRVQLRKLRDWGLRRRQNVNRIWECAEGLPGIRVPKLRCAGCETGCSFKECVNAAYKCYVFVEGGEALRNKFLRKINELGVPCYSGSCSEVYLEKAFEKTGHKPKARLPIAKHLGETSLMFLCDPTLTDRHIDQTCRVLKKVVLGSDGGS